MSKKVWRELATVFNVEDRAEAKFNSVYFLLSSKSAKCVLFSVMNLRTWNKNILNHFQYPRSQMSKSRRCL